MLMTKQKALQILRSGKSLEVEFQGESTFEVSISIREICDFSRRRRWEHDKIGPIHVRFWSGGSVHWIHITEKQLDGFLNRNCVG